MGKIASKVATLREEIHSCTPTVGQRLDLHSSITDVALKSKVKVQCGIALVSSMVLPWCLVWYCLGTLLVVVQCGIALVWCLSLSSMVLPWYVACCLVWDCLGMVLVVVLPLYGCLSLSSVGLPWYKCLSLVLPWYSACRCLVWDCLGTVLVVVQCGIALLQCLSLSSVGLPWYSACRCLVWDCLATVLVIVQYCGMKCLQCAIDQLQLVFLVGRSCAMVAAQDLVQLQWEQPTKVWVSTDCISAVFLPPLCAGHPPFLSLLYSFFAFPSIYTFLSSLLTLN